METKDLAHKAKDNVYRRLIKRLLDGMEQTDKEAGAYDKKGEPEPGETKEHELAESPEFEAGETAEKEEDARADLAEGAPADGEASDLHSVMKKFMQPKRPSAAHMVVAIKSQKTMPMVKVHKKG